MQIRAARYLCSAAIQSQWFTANSKEDFLCVPVVLTGFTISLEGSNHYGIAGWYSMKALQYGLIVSFV